ncbi:MAG: exodeoxyribonuclease V subunit alpha [Burkholderiaceae bacterium]
MTAVGDFPMELAPRPTGGTPVTQLDMLALLQRWREAGWLRRLDVAFARFMHALDPQAPSSLLLACALLAQLEGRGHSCLPLTELAQRPDAILGWPAAAAPELAAALSDWPTNDPGTLAAWRDRSLVENDPSEKSGSSPLVLQGGLLYLRRYWMHEMRVASGIRARTTVSAVEADMLATAGAQAARDLLGRMFPPGVTADAPVQAAGAGGVGTAEGAQSAVVAGDAERPWGAGIAGATNPAGTNWQKVACALALRRRWTIITGGPGTGKTYTAARLLVLLHALHRGPQPMRMALAAPTGKAAARLRQSIDSALQVLQAQLGDALPLADWAAQLGPARTLHSLLGARPGTRRFRHDAANPLDLDVLFVDEASMVHLEMMASLLDGLPAGARVVLLGDKDQLASVEAGAVMGELCGVSDNAQPSSTDLDTRNGNAIAYWPETADWVHRFSGEVLPASALGQGSELAQQTIVLRESHRFAGPIGQLALAVNRGDGAQAIAVLRAGPDSAVSLIEARDAGIVARLAVDGRVEAPGGYGAYLEQMSRRPADASAFDAWARTVLRGFDGFRVLCAVREGPWGVAGLNAAIERALTEHGLLQRRGEWYEGRPVMVTRNDPDLGVFNGDIGVVLRSPAGDGSLRCYFLDGEELRSVAVGRMADVETAFAMTVHKSQGSEFAHVLLVFPEEDMPVLTRELVYTGITRARQAFTLVTRHPGMLALAAARQTRRVSGLRAMLAA